MCGYTAAEGDRPWRIVGQGTLWGMADVKDRQSRMAYSTVAAPPKKDGKGGKFTWGGAGDVTDYEPVGVGQVGVVTVASPTLVMPSRVVASTPQPFQMSLSDASQFPALGVAAAPQAVKTTTWGPPASPIVVAAPSPQSVKLSTDNLRPGATELFDGQHPRNTFAPKPRKSTTGGEMAAIDWSEPGIPKSVRSSIIQSSSNAAHLSIYTTQPAPTPVTVLRAQPVYTQQVVQPKVQKQVIRRPVMIHQPQRR